MNTPRFAHLHGRRMWERCDHFGTRLEGAPSAVKLAPAVEAAPAAADAARYAQWQQRWGSVIVRPCAPDQCADAETLLLAPGAGLQRLSEDGWQALPLPSAPTPPRAGLDFAPLAPPSPPAAPDAIALDPAGRCWLLDRAGNRLLRLSPERRIDASVALPSDFVAGAFGCSAAGLIVTEYNGPRLLFQAWGGRWQGYQLPAAHTAPIVALAADPRWPLAVALVKPHRGGKSQSWQMLQIGANGVSVHGLPLAQQPLQLLLSAPNRVLVGEALGTPGAKLPYRFREYLFDAKGFEAERGFAVRGFDGRGLWLAAGPDGERPMASTASGARPLYVLDDRLRGDGYVETWALDSGIFQCTWHRLFVDLCLPADCAIRIEAKSADALPPFELRRAARLPADLATDPAASRPPAAADDPWPPLGSRVAGETEGWVTLGVADRRPPHADIALADSVGEAPSGDDAKPSPPPAAMQTLEYLLTPPPGRYLWLRLHLQGTARQGPSLFALRASFPRPSLLDYLPAYWRSDPEGADATTRALALFEGWTTELDGRIDALPRLLDPRRVPAEALPWLADFVALSFDARLREGVRRRLLAEAVELYRARGTLPGLTRLLSLIAEGPVQIVEGFRLRRPTAAFVGDSTLGPALEIGGADSPLAQEALGAQEDWQQELAAAHTALLLTRATQDQPCPAEPPPDPLPDDALIAFYRRHAHRFTVIVPRRYDASLAAMLELAIEQHKPAHTLHALCWIDAGFSPGRALVGIARLGPVLHSAPAVLGSATLSAFSTLHHGRCDARRPTFKPSNRREATP